MKVQYGGMMIVGAMVGVTLWAEMARHIARPVGSTITLTSEDTRPAVKISIHGCYCRTGGSLNGFSCGGVTAGDDGDANTPIGYQLSPTENICTITFTPPGGRP